MKKENKTVWLTIRVHTSFKKLIKKKANAAGMSVSNYLMSKIKE